MKMKILIQISNLEERLNPTDILNRIFQQQQKSLVILKRIFLILLWMKLPAL